MPKITVFETKDIYFQLDKLTKEYSDSLDRAALNLGKAIIREHPPKDIEDCKMEFGKYETTIWALQELRTRLGWLQRHELTVGENNDIPTQ